MECYFDIEYKNNAWGFVNTGTLIINDGGIYKYDLLDDGEHDLNSKFNNSVLVGRLSPNQLLNLCQAFTQLNPNTPIKTERVMFDGGNVVISGYHDDVKVVVAVLGNNFGVIEGGEKLAEELSDLGGYANLFPKNSRQNYGNFSWNNYSNGTPVK